MVVSGGVRNEQEPVCEWRGFPAKGLKMFPSEMPQTDPGQIRFRPQSSDASMGHQEVKNVLKMKSAMGKIS